MLLSLSTMKPPKRSHPGKRENPRRVRYARGKGVANEELVGTMRVRWNGVDMVHWNPLVAAECFSDAGRIDLTHDKYIESMYLCQGYYGGVSTVPPVRACDQLIGACPVFVVQRRIFSRIAAVLAVVVAVAGFAGGAGAAWPARPDSLLILHTNDVHAHLVPFVDSKGET